MTATPSTCDTYDTLREFFIQGEFVTGWDCVMTGGDPATQLMLFTLIFGGVELALFITTAVSDEPLWG